MGVTDISRATLLPPQTSVQTLAALVQEEKTRPFTNRHSRAAALAPNTTTATVGLRAELQRLDQLLARLPAVHKEVTPSPSGARCCPKVTSRGRSTRRCASVGSAVSVQDGGRRVGTLTFSGWRGSGRTRRGFLRARPGVGRRAPARWRCRWTRGPSRWQHLKLLIGSAAHLAFPSF